MHFYLEKHFHLLFYRQITQDYTESQTRALSRQSSLDRNANPVCPICVDVEIIQDNTAAGVHAAAPLPPGTFRQNTCSECERIVCKDCGSFELNQKTKVGIWKPVFHLFSVTIKMKIIQ